MAQASPPFSSWKDGRVDYTAGRVRASAPATCASHRASFET